jgi:hypothetical protein
VGRNVAQPPEEESLLRSAYSSWGFRKSIAKGK